MELSVDNNSLTGVVASEVLGRVMTAPVTGVYQDGICTVTLKSDTFKGPCDAHSFAGQRLSKKAEVVGAFDFRNADELPSARGAPASPTSDTAPAPPVSAAASVWSLGRVRQLVEHGGCSADLKLGGGFCFNNAVDWLRRHPDKPVIDAVATDQSYVNGSMLPFNSGQGWHMYDVKRRGDGFAAERHLHLTTKVPVPPGCMTSGVLEEAWFITTAGGRRVAVEARRYGCAAWNGPAVYTGGIDTAEIDGGRLENASIANPNGGDGGTTNDAIEDRNPLFERTRQAMDHAHDELEATDMLDQAFDAQFGPPTGTGPHCTTDKVKASMAIGAGARLPLCPPASGSRRNRAGR